MCMPSRSPLAWVRALMRRLVAVKDLGERSLLASGSDGCAFFAARKTIPDLSAVEFRVFSQWGEDGIIEWLAAHVPVPNTRFVEFGVETFSEANCRFLLQNRNWKGLVMDGSTANLEALKVSPIFMDV